ncbi:hypothetical protein Fmac_025812 [Flemingia macrophylla]|uniref:P-loop containing nucleoside triphosphate hydrolases superfamily protein n=1 Tax=Flemingia macrophylla TaxID=520843 RepID=A0ABD1LD35_9FABA
MERKNYKKEEVLGRGLLDQVFSWSISDILEENLYRNQVMKIPETFSSTSIYMRSFILPLVEEMHADLLSSIRRVSEAPISQISKVRKAKNHQSASDLFYQFTVCEKQGAYLPAVGDLIAVTNVRPRCINDLNSHCVIAFVHRASEFSITVLSSKLITTQDNSKEILFAVYLTNMNTNIRIWRSLNGTGKTTTVSLMLSCLLKLKCRTLTCAPTNVAVLEIAKRVLDEVRKNESSGCGSCRLGDIVLFGNAKRMNMDDHNQLCDVFLDYRVLALRKCVGGWKHSLAAIISLLENPRRRFLLYLDQTKKKVAVDCQTQNKKNEQDTAQPWTFEEFVNKRFDSLRQQLTSCFMNLYKHLPTSFISKTDVMNTFRARDLLHSISTLLSQKEGIEEELYGFEHNDSRVGCFSKLRLARNECLKVLKLLPEKFYVEGTLRDFCLANACLVFCTASSSAKLHVKGMSPIELLVIDEAAQLKECEATMPLQLCGVRHSILIGDEMQLPAMVQSKISENAGFGRSLFERLVQLGLKKHLLNVQHRMHPSISLFPNTEFYRSEILDGQNVRKIGYGKSPFPQRMYSSYSFINMPLGKEEFDDNHSLTNMIEASLVLEIVKLLREEYVRSRTNKKMQVGIISPYKAQVYAIEEKVKRHARDYQHGGIEVNVGSVDGFQGGEADVIIMSTVRCNNKGCIGFLSDRRRVNVALTRARHCLWILGNETTLLNSESVWKKLVIDAKERGCFYDAQEDKRLAKALLYSLNEVKDLHNFHSSLRNNARWQVHFSDEFWDSLRRVGNRKTFEKVFRLLEKLSSGWRENHKKKTFVYDGLSSEHIEQYKVNGPLRLVWTVDVIHENLHCIQVMMVWAILPHSDMYRIAKRIDTQYSKYTALTIDQCRYKCVERSHSCLSNCLQECCHSNVVAMEDSSTYSEIADGMLSKSLASLGITDNNETMPKNLLPEEDLSMCSEIADGMLSKSLASLRIAGNNETMPKNVLLEDSSTCSEITDGMLSKPFAIGRADNNEKMQKYLLPEENSSTCSEIADGMLSKPLASLGIADNNEIMLKNLLPEEDSSTCSKVADGMLSKPLASLGIADNNEIMPKNLLPKEDSSTCSEVADGMLSKSLASLGIAGNNETMPKNVLLEDSSTCSEITDGMLSRPFAIGRVDNNEKMQKYLLLKENSSTCSEITDGILSKPLASLGIADNNETMSKNVLPKEDSSTCSEVADGMLSKPLASLGIVDNNETMPKNLLPEEDSSTCSDVADGMLSKSLAFLGIVIGGFLLTKNLLGGKLLSK